MEMCKNFLNFRNLLQKSSWFKKYVAGLTNQLHYLGEVMSCNVHSPISVYGNGQFKVPSVKRFVHVQKNGRVQLYVVQDTVARPCQLQNCGVIMHKQLQNCGVIMHKQFCESNPRQYSNVTIDTIKVLSKLLNIQNKIIHPYVFYSL